MFVCLHRQGTPFTMGGGRYIDRLEKRKGRWAIAARICVRDWAPLTKAPEVLDQADLTAVALTEDIVKLIRAGAQSSRDRGDPSYQRPLTIDPERIRRP